MELLYQLSYIGLLFDKVIYKILLFEPDGLRASKA
ncbi:MAG: hypothetical protein UV67_C0003G0043 [Parcubacteria group bacterium GW2011_GWC1_43_12]|nr:MAG: hypothetical protein UV67_C0003G0043 [Parcubacteria group bacterium GW2011_GWC1_43_12]